MHLLVLGRHISKVAVKNVEPPPVKPWTEMFEQPEHRSHLSRVVRRSEQAKPSEMWT